MSEFLGITCRAQNICNRPAETIIIYGCYDLHLSELAVCGKCQEKWQYRHKDNLILCHCGRMIRAYQTTPITHITTKYRNEYLHATSAPNTREPYTHEP